MSDLTVTRARREPAAWADSGDALRIDDLVVDYGHFTVGPIQLTLRPGAIHCLVGANGSGKSSLVHTVLGLQDPSSGTAWWKGRELPRRDLALLTRLGYVSDTPDDVIAELSAPEYWEFAATAYGRSGAAPGPMCARADQLADALDLLPAPRQRIGDFSLGMRRKTQLVAALMHEPDLVVLDEPIVGLDYVSTRRLEGLLHAERVRGATVWMVGHDLGVVTRVADQVVALRAGQVVANIDTANVSAPDLERRLLAALSRPKVREGS